jgi:hypothetical protein
MRFTFIDGKERDIKFSFADVLKLQKEEFPGDEPAEEAAMRTCRWIAIGLQRSEPGITPEQVADLIEVETFKELRQALDAALGRRKTEEPRPTPEG